LLGAPQLRLLLLGDRLGGVGLGRLSWPGFALVDRCGRRRSYGSPQALHTVHYELPCRDESRLAAPDTRGRTDHGAVQAWSSTMTNLSSPQ